jgi:hypothetical protein
VDRNHYNLPESIFKMRGGKLALTEVKNQRRPDIGNALAKFEDVGALLEGQRRQGGRQGAMLPDPGAESAQYQIGRMEIYVPEKPRFDGFDDTLYTIVGPDDTLYYNGQQYFVDVAPGIPIRVIHRSLGPPAP